MTKPVIEPLEQRRLLDGTPDVSYGINGGVLADFRNTNDAIAMDFYDDGSHVVVGTTQQSNGSKDIFVARYNIGGILDANFGVGGVTFLDFNGADDIATAVKLDDNDKIVVAGTTGNSAGTSGDAWVARWDSLGRLDLGFNKTGYHVLDFGGLDAVSGLMLDRMRMDTGDSEIVIAGASANVLSVTSGIALAKFTNTGGLDYDFGPGTGIVITSPGRGVFEGATSLSKYGSRYLVSGFQFTPLAQSSRFMVASFDCKCGDLDETFGVGGRAFADFGGNIELGMEARYDKYSNRIYAVGVTGDGPFSDPIPGLPKLSVGGVASSSRFAVARWLTNGALDTGFNGTGMNTIDFSGYKAAATSMIIQGDGRVIVGGGAQSLSSGLSDFAFARILTDGTLDTSFRDSGRHLEDVGGASDGAFRLFQRRGIADSFYAVGHSKFNSTFGRAVILRYLIASSVFGPVPALIAISNLRRLVAPTTGTLDFRVRLMRPITSPLTVNYATRDGQSVGGIDYTPMSGTLTFNPGEKSKTISIPYHDSHNGALPGSFYVDLSSPSSGFISNPSALASLRFLAPNLNQLRVHKVTPIKFPNTIVGGQKVTGAFARVVLKNFSKKLITGSELLQVYGSVDRRLDAKGDPLLAKSTVNVNVRPGKTQAFNVPIPLFAAGQRNTQYHLLAAASGAGVKKAATNYTRGANPFLVTTPTVTLSGPAKARPAVSFPFGGKGNISFPLTNKGNAAAVGQGTIVLSLIPNGAPTALRYVFNPKNVAINVAAGKTQTITTNITAPGSNLGLVPGKYNMFVLLQSTKLLQYKNTTDNSILATIPFTLK